jgi:protein OS-9
MKLNSSAYLCGLPLLRQIASSEDNSTSLTQAEEEKERLRARNKGWELLRPLEGNCMYIVHTRHYRPKS